MASVNANNSTIKCSCFNKASWKHHPDLDISRLSQECDTFWSPPFGSPLGCYSPGNTSHISVFCHECDQFKVTGLEVHPQPCSSDFCPPPTSNTPPASTSTSPALCPFCQAKTDARGLEWPQTCAGQTISINDGCPHGNEGKT